MEIIKVTYSEVTNTAFTQAVQRLANTPMNLRMAYSFKKIADAAIKLKKQIAKEYETDLLNKYAKKDEHGKLVVAESHEGFVVDDANKEAFNKAEKEFGERTASLGREKISLAFLDGYGLKLTPADLKALECIFTDDLEEESKTASA